MEKLDSECTLLSLKSELHFYPTIVYMKVMLSQLEQGLPEKMCQSLILTKGSCSVHFCDQSGLITSESTEVTFLTFIDGQKFPIIQVLKSLILFETPLDKM